jgi:hypothetical protein
MVEGSTSPPAGWDPRSLSTCQGEVNMAWWTCTSQITSSYQGVANIASWTCTSQIISSYRGEASIAPWTCTSQITIGLLTWDTRTLSTYQGESTVASWTFTVKHGHGVLSVKIFPASWIPHCNTAAQHSASILKCSHACSIFPLLPLIGVTTSGTVWPSWLTMIHRLQF